MNSYNFLQLSCNLTLYWAPCISQEPRVLVVDPATVGLQKNVQITNEDTKQTTELQNVFDKLFGNSLQGITDLNKISDSNSATEDKSNIILGALRDILLICEVCKKKVPPMTPSTTISTTTTTKETSTRPPTTKRPGKAIKTTVPPTGLCAIKWISSRMFLLHIIVDFEEYDFIRCLIFLVLDLCPFTFNTYPDASCILYDDEKCNGDEGVKVMGNGDVALNFESINGFDVESVSIKQGCKLTIYTGNLKK